MNTLISILGPTASGKTSFALKLSEQALSLFDINGVDLISADSRQVYKGLEVLSGADIPDGFKKIIPNDLDAFPCYENKKIRLHGVSILSLSDEWSVAHFKNFATEIIKNSFANNRLPIIVGGTSLYINHLFNRDNSLYIKPIPEVRSKAKLMSIEELQNWLKTVNSKKFSEMNNSDVNNSRRLVRAIEVSIGKPEIEKVMNLPDQVINLKIGLSLDLGIISNKINKRVIERFNGGAVEEVEKLNKKLILKDQASRTALGVSDITAYIKNEVSREKCIEDWSLHEFQYAKRQLVWLKKEKDIVWLDDLEKSSYTLSSKLF